MRQESKKVFVTSEKLKEMQDELDNLITVKRKEISAKIKEALAYGDISENAEYDEARNMQAMVEARIKELDAAIRNAEVFKEHKATTANKGNKAITIGSTVTVQQKGKQEVIEFIIVGATEANPYENKVSNESPIGSALLKRQPGDKVVINTPSGAVEYSIKSAK